MLEESRNSPKRGDERPREITVLVAAAKLRLCRISCLDRCGRRNTRRETDLQSVIRQRRRERRQYSFLRQFDAESMGDAAGVRLTACAHGSCAARSEGLLRHA